LEYIEACLRRGKTFSVTIYTIKAGIPTQRGETLSLSPFQGKEKQFTFTVAFALNHT
jgi:hypothetical protein